METTHTLTLQEFIRDLIRPEPVPAATRRIRDEASVLFPPEETGIVAEIDEETWDWFLDVLPPHYMQRGLFCFAEGFTPFHMFFRRAGRCFVRRLTGEETETFCWLADIPMPGHW